MRSFIYNNKVYNSLHEACSELNVSYQKVRRLCRHYTKAQKDPAQAIRWVLGVDRLTHNEQKTFKYQQDLEKGYERQLKFKEHVRERVLEMIKN